MIVPCYQEEESFNIEAYKQYLNSEEYLGLCLVNDGSKDNTLQSLEQLKKLFPERVQVIDLPQNVGKAEAVRYGMQHADFEGYEFTGYFDADLAFPLTQVRRFFNEISETSCPDFIIGARVKLYGSTSIERPVVRHVFSRVFATIVSSMLKLGVYDTQTGAKLIRVSKVEKLFSDPFISKWLFDIELIYRFIQNNGRAELQQKLWELPIFECYDDGKSSVRKSFMFKVPFELFKIWRKYRRV